jgi:acetoacetate decarboxylase
LTKAKFGFSMPVDAPLYGPPPYAFTGGKIATFVYATDPTAAAGLLPDALELTTPAMAAVVIAQYDATPFGPYKEAVQMIMCQYQQAPLMYVARMLVSSVAAMAVGREVWGFPKNLADIEFQNVNGAITSSVARQGSPIAGGSMHVGAALDPSTMPAVAAATLRVIPSPLAGPPEIAEIVTLPPSRITSMWTGTGASCQVSMASKSDPWGALPVVSVVAATYGETDFELGYGQVIVRL